MKNSSKKNQINSITNIVEEPLAVYSNSFAHNFISQDAIDDKRIIQLSDAVNKGIGYNFFKKLTISAPFSNKDWSDYLHLSERSLLRYKKDEKSFETTQSEKLLEIALLMNYGYKVFSDKQNFHAWLETINIALGNKMPKDFLTNTFGINFIKDELTRIEHGVFS